MHKIKTIMPKLLHRVLCNVSRRYRVAHCQHVDELPRRIQRKLLESCREVDPRMWDTPEEMFADLDRELDEEEQRESKEKFRKVAVFA